MPATLGKSSEEESLVLGKLRTAGFGNLRIVRLLVLAYVVRHLDGRTGDLLAEGRIDGPGGPAVGAFDELGEVLGHIGIEGFALAAVDKAVDRLGSDNWLVGVTRGGTPASRRTWGTMPSTSSAMPSIWDSLSWASILVYMPPGSWAVFTIWLGSG